jgi:hypothetical protein
VDEDIKSITNVFIEFGGHWLKVPESSRNAKDYYGLMTVVVYVCGQEHENHVWSYDFVETKTAKVVKSRY